MSRKRKRFRKFTQLDMKTKEEKLLPSVFPFCLFANGWFGGNNLKLEGDTCRSVSLIISEEGRREG